MDQSESLEQFFSSLARDSWALFQRDPLTFVLSAVVAMLVGGLSLGILAGPLAVGLFDMVRRAERGEPIEVGQVFERFDSLVSCLVAFVLIGCAVGLGCALLVLPGLAAALFCSFTLQAIAYEQLTGIAAIKRSIGIVRVHFLKVLVLVAALSVAQTLGGSVVFGLLLTLPLSAIAAALAYARLAGPAPSAEPSSELGLPGAGTASP